MSFWTKTAKINLELADGSSYSLFLKVAKDDVGRGMLCGEYEGVAALYEIAPDFVPFPVAWGTNKSDPNTHFYLCEFIDMVEKLPDVQKFCARLAKMHRDSISRSTNGRFGFHIITYEGNMYQDVTWCDSWEELFSRAMRAFVKQEHEVHGPSQELEELLPAFFDKVIPRLLRPLQNKGRTIKPVLVHGDIWYGNIATNPKSDSPIMFDPAVFWAHNECKYIHIKGICCDFNPIR